MTKLAASVACVIDADKVEQVRDDVMRIYRATEDKVGSEQWGSDAFEAYSARFSEVKDTVAFRELMAYLKLDTVDIDVLPWNERGMSFWKSCGFAETCVSMRYRR